LTELIDNYKPLSNRILRPLIEGGPAKLANEFKLELKLEKEYVDECHLCYTVRKQLIDKFPDILTPKQVYGIIEKLF
jgi:hypothetical protein